MMTTSTLSPDPSSDSNSSHPDEHLACVPKTSTASQPCDDSKSSISTSGMDTPLETTSEKTPMDARHKISSLLKEKEQEWTAIVEKERPLRLLDLPMDILKEIVKEVTHTNDLTALALTHSALHNIAIPYIYSRFDIVWPDAHATSDPRTGVDALTYGLATLVMGDCHTPNSNQQFACMNCGTMNAATCSHSMALGPQNEKRRLGNHYSQYTRKFSLGNGPPDWVQEYLITKESGKMLGTLVAVAVAKMVNLETFVWDMPTGVLRDVWLALSSLQTRNYSRDCRLERVWVRWHDNAESGSLPTGSNPASTTNSGTNGSTMTTVGWTVSPALAHSVPTQSTPLSYAQSRVEYPTLSVLPPLKSLSVLDIDELDYLDEMSVLIAKSKDRLRELRVGISEKACRRDFANTWDGPGLHQVDHNASWPGASTIGEKRLGGVLGVLLGRVYDIRKTKKTKSEKKGRAPTITKYDVASPTQQSPAAEIVVPTETQNGQLQQHDLSATEGGNADYSNEHEVPSTVNGGVVLNLEAPVETITNSPTMFDLNTQQPDISGGESAQSDMDSLSTLISAHSISAINEGLNHITATESSVEQSLRRSKSQSRKHIHISETPSPKRETLDGKLRLQTLELERVPLSISVLAKAFDWSILTNLTILDCAQHDKLWVMLRKHFHPSPPINHCNPSSKNSLGSSSQYHLNIKKVHTDAVSPALISFLKETLAPNTLEILFLQDRKRSSASSVTIDAIYRGPLKRHRGSLKKLMLDSSNGIPRSPTSSSENPRWRAWMPSRDVLNFITSGRMSSLRELSIAIEYKDWHHFLQRLPQIPHLRSLNIPFIADHVTPSFDPRDLAMQIVDVIVLRPEVELCYVGISHKCFEILENRPHDESYGIPETPSHLGNVGPGGTITDDDGSDDEASEDDDDEEEDDNGTAIAAQIDPDETESELSDHDDDSGSESDTSDDGRSKVRVRLREILFYDDKVAIFKARHGKL